MACRKIAAGVGGDICTLEVGGVKDTAYIGNRDDIDVITRDANEMLVTGITMKATTKLYKITGVKGSIRPSYGTIEGTYTKFFRHRVEFLAFDNKKETLKTLNDMNGSDMFIFVLNNNQTVEILGLGAGLELQDLTRDYQNRDQGLAPTIVLETADDENKQPERTIPVLYLDGLDYASTVAALEAKAA